MTEAAPSPVRVHAIAVTYRRPGMLRSTLLSFLGQTRPPDSILVVDNGADAEVEGVVKELDLTSYLPMPENVGPAGGYAAGMQAVLRHCGPSDWILLIDDDDPAPFDWLLQELLRAVDRCATDVAAVGLAGSRYDRRTGIVHRIRDADSGEWTDIDYIGSGNLPLYRVAAVREIGPMNPDLFFGFEDLEFGLRLRSAGWRLVKSKAIGWRVRSARDAIRSGPMAPPSTRPAEWRTYYSARNEVYIARSLGEWMAPLAVSFRVAAGGAKEVVRSRSISEFRLRMLGLSHGWQGRFGRTIEPTIPRTA